MTLKIFKMTSVHPNSSAKAVLLLISVLLLSACASQPRPDTDSVARSLPKLKQHGPELHVADVDILEVSPAMEEFLERHVLRYADLRTRSILLLDAVSRNGPLGFEYDESLTLSASDAFDRRAGNCIAYANMIIALARRAGLKAHYQEVFRERDWSSRENSLLLIKHINVVIASNPHNSTVVDISGLNIGPMVRQRTITDDFAKALHLNNLGVELMLNNKLPAAYAYFRKATEVEPMVIDSWVNVGVVFGRNNQLNDAEAAFQTALQIDQSEYSAMSNLYEVFVAQENLEAAQELYAQVEKHRLKNPYYLLRLSDEALQNQQFDESISLLRRAIRKKGDDHELHFALAKTQYLSGETKAAEDSLERARDLAPDNMLAEYNRPLNELMADYK